MTKPRLALCISGQPRTWRHCIDSQMACFADYDVDVFFHTWDDVEPSEQQALRAAYQPVAHAFAARPDFTAHKRNLIQRFGADVFLDAFDMFYSAQQSITMALASGQTYDAIARIRFDLLLDGAVSAKALDLNVLNTFDWMNENFTTDYFFITAPHIAQIYAGVYDYILNDAFAYYPIQLFVAEAVLRYYLNAHGIRHHYVRDVAHCLLRNNRIGWTAR